MFNLETLRGMRELLKRVQLTGDEALLYAHCVQALEAAIQGKVQEATEAHYRGAQPLMSDCESEDAPQPITKQ